MFSNTCDFEKTLYNDRGQNKEGKVPRCCIIYNPVAGEGTAHAILPQILEFLSRKYGRHEICVQATEGNNHATMLAEKAYRMGEREFLCIGGDGTFNEMCQPLVGRTDIRVSLVPTGTGNDLARAFGFSSSFSPVEWEDFFDDDAVLIDAGKCNERYFFNTMGIGFDALVALEFRKWGWIPRHWRYYPPIFKNLLFYRGYPMEINGQRDTIFLLSVGNGRSSGGGISLTPEAWLNDGHLDLCWIENVGIFQRLKNLLLTLKGKHTSLPFVHTTRFQTLSLRSSQGAITHIDGEIYRLSQWEISVVPRALPVFVRKSKAWLI